MKQKIYYFYIFLAIALFSPMRGLGEELRINIDSEIVTSSNEGCLECHENEKISEYISSTNKAVYISGKSFLKSAHGEISCIDCHDGFEAAPHIKKIDVEAVCAKSCHTPEGNVDAPDFKERFQEWEHSVHGVKKSIGPRSERCDVCHTKEEINSLKSNDRPPACGLQPGCTDCHNVHEQKKSSDPSTLFEEKLNTQKTCGTCHTAIEQEFSESVHFTAFQNQEKSPTCNDCHGEHKVTETAADGAKTSNKYIVSLCTDCHDSLPSKTELSFYSKAESYERNFHGKIYKSGDYEMANCASCHGNHGILNSENPKSMVHKDNLAKTCGQSNCHANLSPDFEVEAFHKPMPATYITNMFMTWLIILTVFGWIVFLGLDNYRHIQIARKNKRDRKELGISAEEQQKQQEEAKQSAKYVEPIKRFDFFIRVQHFIMMIGVLLCLITGMPIRFAYLDSVASFFHFIDGIQLARFLHKVGGVLLYIAGFTHLYYIIFTGVGRRTFIQLMPRIRDFVDFWETLRFYFGKRPDMPGFARFSYIEKFDYWAAYWGMTIFLTTGAILTIFEKWAHLVPPLWGDTVLRISVVVHSQEALLETIALLLWHLYWTHLNRRHFPANMVIFTGTAKFDAYYHEYRDHVAELKEQGKLTPNQLDRFIELERERNK